MRRIGFLTERMRLGFGTDLCIHELARRLADRYEVKVFACVDDGTYRDPGYEIVRYRTPHIRQNLDYERAVLRNAGDLRPHRLDLLIPATYPFFGVPSRLGIPAIMYDMGVVPSRGLASSVRFTVEYMRLTNRYWQYRSAAVVTLSEFLRSTFPWWTRRKTRVIYIGADHILAGDGLPPREAVRRRYGAGPDDVLFAFIGRLDLGTPYKGVAELVESFQRVRLGNDRARLVMCGFGSASDENQLSFQGASAHACVPQHELKEALHACDVFITGTRWEGFNLPVVEAQLMGRPCIAYAVAAHPEVVGPGGFLVTNQDEFVARMEQLAADRDLRARMGEAATGWAARFRWDAAAAAFAETIETVLA
jgi:glycosyltransferase involved in cell wall biosynthesis